jgi:S1-C subfamily serine protease
VLASDPDLEIGSPTVALGAAERPAGDPAVSTGVVRALGRRLDIDGRTLHGLIETDAAIDPASVGGPLLDPSGAVIGIITGLHEPEGAVGHATPIDLARRVADHLVESGQMTHAWLGIESQDQASAGDATAGDETAGDETAGDETAGDEGAVVEGAVIRSVGAGSPAEAGGLAAGDVIVELDGSSVGSSSALVVALREHEPGDEVIVTYWRDGEEHQAAVICGER